MKKLHVLTVRILTVFVFCLLFSSCFDVVEEINLKNNGSGKIKATVNMSKSKTKVASIMLLDSVSGIKIPSKASIQKEMNTVVALLKKTSGISNVSSSLDFTNYIASIECDFSDVKALNAFTKTVSDHFKVKISGYTSYSYDAANRLFNRGYTYSPDIKKEWNKLDAEAKKSIAAASYTGIYRFESSVKSQQNTQAKISPNKKAVMLRTTIPQLAQGSINLSNKIYLEK